MHLAARQIFGIKQGTFGALASLQNQGVPLPPRRNLSS